MSSPLEVDVSIEVRKRQLHLALGCEGGLLARTPIGLCLAVGPSGAWKGGSKVVETPKYKFVTLLLMRSR